MGMARSGRTTASALYGRVRNSWSDPVDTMCRLRDLMKSRAELSITEARRVALAAQGFDRARPRGRVTAAQLRRTLRALGLVQLDFVTVLVPAHYQVLFSRLGPYPRTLLDDLVYRSREFTEQWAHEASIVPMDCWPLLEHRRQAHRVRPWGFDAFLKRHADYVKIVLEAVRERGPLTADTLEAPQGVARRIPGSWLGTVPRAVLEAHFGRGGLAIADRRPSFARAYDLAARVIPAEHRGRTVEREEAERELLLRAARAQGIGTAADLADHYRMPVREARPRIEELVRAGKLREARVQGWREAAYLHPGAVLPRKIEVAALLSPFDPLIWYRPRVARLFGFDYRFEVFVPKTKRRWGAYVLPFLLGERLVARVDLKADRAGGRLLVLAAFVEVGIAADVVARALAGELRTLAAWLSLDSISVGRRGGLSRRLSSALRC